MVAVGIPNKCTQECYYEVIMNQSEVRLHTGCSVHFHPSRYARPLALFPPPVFDRILYAKMEGEGLGERVTCVTSGGREGRHRGGGARPQICSAPTHTTHKLGSSKVTGHFRAYSTLRAPLSLSIAVNLESVG